VLGALVVLSASIVVLAMSGGGATDVTDSNSLEVDKITDVDFGQISGARVVVLKNSDFFHTQKSMK
jgi:hypothetical protein